eukprot:1155458-Pelagomonas_calceolata.AAC.3
MTPPANSALQAPPYGCRRGTSAFKGKDTNHSQEVKLFVDGKTATSYARVCVCVRARECVQ